MPEELEVEVFRTGDYGAKGTYDEGALDRLAADYNPAQLHEAPVTLDHNQSGPAHGWVARLCRQGDRLMARLHHLNADLLGLIRQGAYKKRSIELYRALPETGRPYLRAVSFLGAAAPEVKGLADPAFAEGASDTIEFAASEESAAVVADDAALLSEASPLSPPSPQRPPSPPASPEDSRAIDAFCEELLRQGRFLPAWEAMGIRAFLAQLAQAPAIAFSEDAEPVAALPWFRRFLESLPPLVPFGESAAQASAPQAWMAMPDAMPHGARIDNRSVSLHRRVQQLMAEDAALPYAEALRRVAQ